MNMSEMSHEQIDQYLDESFTNIRNGEVYIMNGRKVMFNK